MDVIGYTEDGMIRVDLDGAIAFVPDDLDNRHRQEIADWEALGNTILPYEAPPPSTDDVNAERERRILAGTTVTVPGIGSIPVQGRDEDARNLQALGFAASLRIGAGDAATLTTFRDAENFDHDLTPPQILALWQGAADYVSAVYQASWALKEMAPIPADYSNPSYWP